MSVSAWLQLFLLSVVWGASFFFIEVMLTDIEPITAMWLRFVVGSLGLVMVTKSLGLKYAVLRDLWKDYAVTGLLISAAPFILIALGQQSISGSMTSIIMALSPITTMVVAHFLTSDEKLSINKIIGAVLGITSVVVLMLPNVSGESSIIGQLMVVLATLCFAFGTIYAKRLHAVPPMLNALGQCVYAVIWITPLMVIFESPAELNPSISSWLAVFGIGFLSTTLGFVFFYNILKAGGASNVILVSFLVPISASLLGVFILNETFESEMWVAYVVVIFALLAIDGRIPKVIRTINGSPKIKE